MPVGARQRQCGCRSVADGERLSRKGGQWRAVAEIRAGDERGRHAGVRVRFLNLVDEFPWLQGFQPRGTKSLPSTRIGVNVTWENNAMRVDTGNFAIHEGFTYLGVPDDLTRLRMLRHLFGMVP